MDRNRLHRYICLGDSVVARLNGDREVAGSIAPGRQHSFVEADHEIFYCHSLL